MTREIKFRAWDEDDEEWVTLDVQTVLDAISLGDVSSLPIGDCILKNLSQFTGLHDKNGREIYEGDILGVAEEECHYESTKDFRWIVNFSSGGFIVNNKEGSYQSTLRQTLPSPLLANKPNGKIVIGTIYQNPELLA